MAATRRVLQGGATAVVSMRQHHHGCWFGRRVVQDQPHGTSAAATRRLLRAVRPLVSMRSIASWISRAAQQPLHLRHIPLAARPERTASCMLRNLRIEPAPPPPAPRPAGAE
jgi:hypothetical protein